MRRYFVSSALLLLTVPALASLPAGWVGVARCAECHDEVVTAFAGGAHGRAMTPLGAALPAAACESCHGPGEAHADDPNRENIRTFEGSTKAQASTGCLSCHAAQHAGLLLDTPGHRRAAVVCLDCHVSGHRPAAGEPLLVRSRRDVCLPCHRTQATQFELPYAHRDGRQRFECMACHSVHGHTSPAGRVDNPLEASCVNCHTEKRGPFVFPHPPREISGCTACHRPHGSPNPKLLTRASVTNLCLECHTGTPAFHNLASPKYRQCQSCHTAVHGSQRDPRLFQE